MASAPLTVGAGAGAGVGVGARGIPVRLPGAGSGPPRSTTVTRLVVVAGG